MITTTTTAEGHIHVHFGKNTFVIVPKDQHTKALQNLLTNANGRGQFNALAQSHGLSNAVRVFLGKPPWTPSNDE